ncbi:MAG: DEAD/DEAH box helicase [Deltaproteobacteria bacterium]|nr:MAG: DEAD/DEAH box helicase [Deltaproteobacteria bacterium]
MNFDVGALVKVRGREWVVLPESNDEPDMLVLRPLGGTDDEIIGVYRPLEPVEAAEFGLPNPETDMGNHLSCGLLRDAIRLGFRSGAGPFRSLARIAVEPRPYQLVPLLMALKLDPVRMLIADDVGIGKTVEACLVARELLDRGEISRLCVLCPPHLAEQWKRALYEQFHIDAALVLSGTVARLEREKRSPDESIFQYYPFTVVSTDYIKQEQRRYEFLRTCPEMVIVDEAHTCAASSGRSARQRRHELLQSLINPEREDCANRHLILVTATPHSGKEDTFRSLISLLDHRFLELPEDLSGNENRGYREDLAKHLVQRRRGDLKAYLDTVTPFPDREIAEEHYTLKPAYRKFMDKVLEYCRETVLDETVEERRQRVRWWSALALLRALSSSPMAAAATLRNRSSAGEGETTEQVDEEGRRAVLDLDDENAEGIDVIPGSDSDEEDSSERERLLRFAREVEGLAGKNDAKLAQAYKLVEQFLEEGYSPILFCRFIPTVEYVADFLRNELHKKGVVVEAITGSLPPEERERRVKELGENQKRVLVCTDCLSEGINLQYDFDAVMHYDLSWNPTRHEQREGRVDRYGQPKDAVRTLTYYGKDNPVDGIVLQVLLRKHKAIHKQLGIAVPVPMETRIIEEAIMQGLLLRETKCSSQMSFEFLNPVSEDVDIQWDASVEREKRRRTVFAQNQLLKAVNTEVANELAEVRRALGGELDVRNFTQTSLRTLGAVAVGDEPIEVKIPESKKALLDVLGGNSEFEAVFSGQPRRNAIKLTRTHPIVEGLAAHVVESALDPELVGPGRRCGVIRTQSVSRRTTILLLRMRFHIVNKGRDGTQRPLLAEDLVVAGFEGSPERAEWLPAEQLEDLLQAKPDENINPEFAKDQIVRVLGRFEQILDHLNKIAEERGQVLFDAHRRVRKATKAGVRALRVDVHKPVDVLGVYVYLPAVSG